MSTVIQPEPAPHCPTLPKAVPGAPVLLCERSGFRIYREPSVGVDFVWPMPGEDELRALYDDPRYFGGDIVGGYRDYNEQTEPLLPQFESLLARYEEPGVTRTILDFGCGGGLHLEVAKRRGWHCHGIEVSDHARNIAAGRLGPGAFLVPSLEALPPFRYDLVVMFDVIEHLPDPAAVFFRLFSLGAIDEKTVVIVATPNARSHEALRDPANWVYRHPPYHVIYYSGEGLAALLGRLKFREVGIEGIFPSKVEAAPGFADEELPRNEALRSAGGVMAIATGCQFPAFMHERYVPGTWSKITRYEHLPRYALARSLAAGRRVLDFGCGTGYGSAFLAETAASVTGCDLDREALEWARSEHAAANLDFLRNEDLGASLPAGSFDLIVCFEVIEHLTAEQQRTVVANFRRLLAPGGSLLVSTPNPQVTAFYGENPFHLHELGAEEFRALLAGEFRSVRVFDQCLGTGVMFRDLASNAGSATKLALGDEAARESACWLALCGQEESVPPGDVVVWDWAAPYVKDAVAADHALIDARGRLISLGYQHGLLQQKFAEVRTRLTERNRDQAQRLQLLTQIASQSVGETVASDVRSPDVLHRLRGLRAGWRWNASRRRHGLEPRAAGKRSGFVRLDVAKEARATVVHLVVAASPALAFDRLATAHAHGPRNLRPDIVLAAGCAPLDLGGAAVSRLPRDRVDAVFHALVRRRPRFLHVHVDAAETAPWLLQVPAIAALLNVPTVVTRGPLAGGDPLPEARASFRECLAPDSTANALVAAPPWPDAAPSAPARPPATVLTWLSPGASGEDVIAVLEALAREQGNLRILAIDGGELPWSLHDFLHRRGLARRCDVLGPCTKAEIDRLLPRVTAVLAPGDMPYLALAALRNATPLVPMGGAAELLPVRRKVHEADPVGQLRWIFGHPSEAAQLADVLWKAGSRAAERSPAAAAYGDVYRELGANS